MCVVLSVPCSNSLENLSQDDFLSLLAVCEAIICLGEEFGRNECSSIKKSIKIKAKNFLEK